MEKEKSAVEFLERQYNFNKQLFKSDFKQAYKIENDALQEHWEDCENGMKQSIYWNNKEIVKEQRGYTESDMRSYASYILNNPVIEPRQWYKIYRNK